MPYQNIVLDKKDHVCVLTINRPPANSWNLETLEEFEMALGEVEDDSLEFANKLADRPPIAVSCILKAIAAGAYEGIDEGLKIEREGVQLLSKTEDAREGVMATDACEMNGFTPAELEDSTYQSFKI